MRLGFRLQASGFRAAIRNSLPVGQASSLSLCRSRIFWIALAIVWIAACADAQAELVVGLYTGANRTIDGRLEVEIPASNTNLRLRDVAWEGRALHRPLYYGGRGAVYLWKVGRFEVGPEFEYIHLKVYLKTGREAPASGLLRGVPRSTVRVDEVFESFSISHGVDLFLLSAAVRRPVAHGRLLLVGRFGAGVNIAHFESKPRGLPYFEHDRFGGLVYHAAGGLEVPVASHFGVLLEYKFTSADPRGPLVSGHAKAHLDTHHVIAGVILRW